jgi:hypothetical protein
MTHETELKACPDHREIYEAARARMLKDATGATFDYHLLAVAFEAGVRSRSTPALPEEREKLVERLRGTAERLKGLSVMQGSAAWTDAENCEAAIAALSSASLPDEEAVERGVGRMLCEVETVSIHDSDDPNVTRLFVRIDHMTKAFRAALASIPFTNGLREAVELLRPFAEATVQGNRAKGDDRPSGELDDLTILHSSLTLDAFRRADQFVRAFDRASPTGETEEGR